MPIPPKPGYAYVYKCTNCHWKDDLRQYSDALLGRSCCPQCGSTNLTVIQDPEWKSLLRTLFEKLIK